MKIDFLIGDNTYGTALHFSKCLAKGLERQGADLRLFWVGEGEFYHAFYEIMADPPDLTCSFSDINLQGTPLGALWRIPHLSLLVDPAIYFLHQFNTPYSLISCVDENDCAFVRTLNNQVFFLPHAADSFCQYPVDHERPYDAVFFGTCLDYEAGAGKWPKAFREVLKSACERVLSREGISILQSLMDLDVRDEDLVYCHNEVDRYIRGRDRIELIKSIQGCKVDIWGEGPWQKFFPKASVHLPIDFEGTLKVMQSAKVVLNSSPRFKAGAHERIFYALMCGSSVYTGENRYLKSQLSSLHTYQYGLWDTPDFTDWQERAKIGQEKVIAAHTWDHRAATLLNFVTREALC